MDPIASSDGRLFFAALPDAVAATRIYQLAEALKRARKLKGRLTELNRFHISLFALSRPWPDLVPRASEAVAGLRMSQFDVSFDRSASFRGQQGNRPFVLLGNEGSSQLTELRLSLDAAMLRNGLRQPRNAGYTPHITLLYDAQEIEELPIEPISWTVSEFVLVHSMHGHLHLARWPLLSS